MTIGVIAITAQILLSVVTELIRRRISVDMVAIGAKISAIAYVVQIGTGALYLSISDSSVETSWKVFGIVALIAIGPPTREVLQFKVNERVDAGSAAVLMNLTTVVTVFFAALLLDDILTFPELLGTAMIVIAASAVAKVGAKMSVVGLSLLIWLAILIALDSAGNLGEAWFIEEYSLATYVFYGLALQAFWALTIAASRGSLKTPIPIELRRAATGYIVTRAIKGILFLIALDLLGSVATVKAITAVTPVAITVAAFFFLKEKEHLTQKLGAAVLASAGLVLFVV